ncbi:methyltransferase [Catenulispora rubra]|uniref:methyltransferase n=1 Tax=Catenulispora rubra TaxID=280293 RepID=UPI00189246F8|nr:methyltransferase [Catenulispora rubra]
MAVSGVPVPPGELELTRFPEDAREQLRAWDAADEYLLRHLDDGSDRAGLLGRVVVVGDRWGAITTSLALTGAHVTQISDSFLGQQATAANLARNGHSRPEVVLASAAEDFGAEFGVGAGLPAPIDVLLVRVPKSLALLEDQLWRLRPFVGPGTRIVGSGMVTEIHTSTLQAFERILGPTRTSLAVRKARLIFCEPDLALPRKENPWPLTYQLPDGIGVASERPVVNYAGTFSADHLDIGTRLFLQHLPSRSDTSRSDVARVVDLGCGNGVVGLAAALANPGAAVTFVDESYQALASARATFEAAFPAGTRDAEFRAGDGMDGFEPGSVDLVLNNPPFHSHQATTDATAWRMFTGSRAALRRGGELWVVGNRHLGYHLKLKRLFGNCEVVGSNPKFVVLRAVRR